MDKKSNQNSLTITFNNADDDRNCYETNGANVNVQVQPRSSTSTHGSSMVKLKNIIGYKWEVKNYPGHLIAIHKDGKIIAYSINVNGRGMVRIIHFGMGNKRALIKGLSKEVLDVQFANCSKEIVLGCIEESALHIYKLEMTDDDLKAALVLKIENPIEGHVPVLDKISWCPFVPEENNLEDEFTVQLAIWIRGNKFECYSIKTIVDNHGVGCYKASDIKEGIVRSHDNELSLITSATFSPDGTTLAVGTADGHIRFYQIYFHEETPHCLHAWNPHEGSPISEFFFLDNHTQPIAGSSLWKYVVTLANNNTEIKISSCDTWKTLQTIKFSSPTGQELSFKAEIDRTSSYLILSDRSNRQLYVLQILKENALSSQNGEETNGNDVSAGGISRVFVKSIAEFHLASTILSYAISNASIRRYKCALSENYLIDELEDFDEENNSLYCVVLKLFAILPESVQECHILYQTALNQSSSADVSDVVLDQETASSSIVAVAAEKSPVPQLLVEPKPNELAALMTPPQKTSQLNLLTPDSFSSPVEKPTQPPANVSENVLSTIFMLAKNNQSTPALAANKSHENVLNLSNCALLEEEKLFQQKVSAETQLPLPLKSASGGSSPSREVQEIMLQADSNTEEFYPPDEDDLELDEPEEKEVLSVLNSLDVTHFKNIDDDDDEDDDEDDGNEEDDEDDEPDVKVKQKGKGNDWPKAPQFMDPSTAFATSKQIEVLSNRMNQMIEIMETQSRYIAELRNEIYSSKTQCVNGTLMTQKHLARCEENCKKAADQSFTKFEGQMINREKHHQRELTEGVMQLFQQNSRTHSAIIDTAVKDTLTRVCSSKPFTDAISQSLLTGTQKSLELTFKKSLEGILIPAYEKITHEMFQEMGKAFTAGTKEYTRAFDTYMKQYGAVQFQMTEFSGAIHGIPQAVKQEIKNLNEQTIVAFLNSKFFNMTKQLEKFEAKMLQEMKDHVKKEIYNGFELQKSSLEDSVLSAVSRSHTETPAPPTAFDHQENIRQLLAHDQINKAFHQALISNDLSLVEFTLEKATFNEVFKSPCPLEQTVLLSLIQQTTADMSRYSELKNRYLNESIINLNMNDPITREHAPKILRELYNVFQTFIATHPANQLNSSMKMIMLAAQSISNM